MKTRDFFKGAGYYVQAQRIPLLFNQAATRSIGAVNNHEGASVHGCFLLPMHSNPANGWIGIVPLSGFSLFPSILARQGGQVQGLEPMLCLEIISRRQALQALCPQGMDTGWFINSLLEWNRTDKKIVVCAKKKKVPKIWTAMRNKSKQTVP